MSFVCVHEFVYYHEFARYAPSQGINTPENSRYKHLETAGCLYHVGSSFTRVGGGPRRPRIDGGIPDRWVRQEVREMKYVVHCAALPAGSWENSCWHDPHASCCPPPPATLFPDGMFPSHPHYWCAPPVLLLYLVCTITVLLVY